MLNVYAFPPFVNIYLIKLSFLINIINPIWKSAFAKASFYCAPLNYLESEEEKTPDFSEIESEERNYLSYQDLLILPCNKI